MNEERVYLLEFKDKRVIKGLTNHDLSIFAGNDMNKREKVSKAPSPFQ